MWDADADKMGEEIYHESYILERRVYDVSCTCMQTVAEVWKMLYLRLQGTACPLSLDKNQIASILLDTYCTGILNKLVFIYE